MKGEGKTGEQESRITGGGYQDNRKSGSKEDLNIE